MASGCGSDNEWAGKDTPVYMMNPRDVLVSVKCCFLLLCVCRVGERTITYIALYYGHV